MEIMINAPESPTMRLQLALNVKDLNEAIDFYSKMFNTEPAKVKPGYANFAINNPPLKLVLFEGDSEGTINHLGVETSSSAEVVDTEQRLSNAGLTPTPISDTQCCYAQKTETWLQGPDSTRWEWYVRTGEADQIENKIIDSHDGEAATICCAEGSSC